MKKITLLFLLMLGAVSFIVAQIPNADMEAWTNQGTYDDLDGWGTLNAVVEGTTKSIDSHGGTYAARLESQNLFIANVPGMMVTGSINTITYSIDGGFPLSTSPGELDGWFKYTPGTGDSCLVVVALTKWNTTTMKRDTVAVGGFASGVTTAAYTQFVAPLYYLNWPNTAIDTGIILIVTSANFTAAALGSILFIDDLSFSGTPQNLNGINDVASSSAISLFPNPAKDKLTVDLNDVVGATQLFIYDVIGNKVRSVPVTSKVVEVSTQSLPNGMYLYRLADANGNAMVNGKFSVKH